MRPHAGVAAALPGAQQLRVLRVGGNVPDREALEDSRAAWTGPLRAGESLRFGAHGEKGIVHDPDRFGLTVAVDPDPADVVVHDPARDNPACAFALSRIGGDDDGRPTPLGVLRAVEEWPTYVELVAD